MARFSVLMMASSVGTGLMSNLTNLSLALKRRGLKVVAISEYKEQAPGLKDKLRDNGIKLFESKYVDGRSPWSVYQGAREIGKIVRSEGIDIIHANGIGHAVKAYLASRLYRQKAGIVQSLHTFHANSWVYDWGFKGTLFMILAPRIMNLCADIVTPVSEIIGQKLIRAGLLSEKTMPVHNGIDIAGFDADVSQSGGNQVQSLAKEITGKPTIIYPAVMVPWKGHRYLLEAAVRVVKEYSEARFIITSDGPLRSQLEKMAQDLNLNGNVIFTGRLGYEDLHWLLSKATIGAFPSLSELLPMAITDMMAASIPVVATSVDGIPEMVIDGKTGFLVPPRDSSTLAKRILELIHDSKTAQEMGATGRKVVEEKFTIDIIAGKVENVYKLASAKNVS
jgi:glycosyltransferase involved in cell wall biosynthesis